MATKARQQYFADEISLQKDSREFSLEDNIKQKIDSVEVGAQVNTIETVKVNGTALTPDANKAVNVEVPDVIDNLYTVAADDALSAKQGKILYDYIQNLQTIGRFLSNWDSTTGLPITNPSESPYLYKAGDYYRVSNVAVSPASNYKPDGSSYTIGVASTTVETLSVAVSDLYLYDGTDWILLSNSGGSIAVDSSLSTTSTNPVENRVITNALNGKHPGAISNVAPSTPVEGMLWYDTVNDELKTYNGTAWQTEGTKMVVLEYGVSTWQDFIDAYNENAIVYCKVSSGSSGYRMAFMAYTAGQGTPTEVEFQYYRSRSSHSQSSTQLDEVYVYKLTNAGVWTTTQRDTGAEMIAGTGIGITFNSSGATISNSGVTSVNGNTGAVTVETPDTKTFYLSSTSDLTTAQAAYDWYAAGKNPIVIYNDKAYVLHSSGSVSLMFMGGVWSELNANSTTKIGNKTILFSISSGNVTSITEGINNSNNVLKTDVNYSSPYTPTYDGSPATKKYVDDNTTVVSGSTPTSPTEGMLWYDTTNDVLKTYDGSNWNECGAGGGIEIFPMYQYGLNTDWTDIITSCANNDTLTILLDVWEDDYATQTGWVKWLVTEYDDGATSGTGRISAMALFNLNGVGSAVPYPKSNKLVVTFNATTKYCTGITQSYTEFVPANSGSTGNVLTKTANGYEWSAPSGGDVLVSSQPNNILTSGMKIRAGTEANYQSLASHDNNTLYLTVE